MEPTIWVFIFFAIAIVMLIAEVFLPSHGLLGIMGTLALVGGIVMCFRINQYLGLAVMLAVVAAAPFAVSASMKIWPRTPLGRRMILQPLESHVQPPTINVGDTGVTLSELRPMGTCEFGQSRVEVRSELGLVAPGARVKVVNIDGGRLIVRPCDT